MCIRDRYMGNEDNFQVPGQSDQALHQEPQKRQFEEGQSYSIQDDDDIQNLENMEESKKLYTAKKSQTNLPRNVREKDVETEEDFEEWSQPRGQSGSGITYLNQKYGY
eukprot:TRINITY_DN5561_c0_g1_i7.p3 TRINITY_DN5561_c0_g1~~TRINITY_DN5561_c0_g1_i7.p3  ORF type:complete len:108 (+),score=26.24 TRINITY_DN5561_c0_g1_i7:64-387(+)